MSDCHSTILFAVGFNLRPRDFKDYGASGSLYRKIFGSIHFRHNSRQVQIQLLSETFIGIYPLFFSNLYYRYGRKTSVTIASILYIICGPVSAFVNIYWLFLICRIGLGLAGSGVYHSAYTIRKFLNFNSKENKFFIEKFPNFSYRIRLDSISINAEHLLQCVISNWYDDLSNFRIFHTSMATTSDSSFSAGRFFGRSFFVSGFKRRR